jgi:perosamine synthetase
VIRRSLSDLPALLGGSPVRPEGPPDWPGADEEVRRAVEAALADGSWGKYHGGHVAELEARLTSCHGVSFALTCGSGTFAVELALRALRVEPGDEVVLAGYDYPGNFLAVHALGARPVLVDVRPDNATLSVERLADALGSATRAVIASHLHGGLTAMHELTALCQQHGVPVIEDTAQVTGASVQGRSAGTWGDVGVLSFGGSKLLSAGRGGALLTSRPEVHQRLRLLLVRANNHVCPLSELQAAALLPQLERLPERHTRRLANVRRLTERLSGLPGLLPFANEGIEGEPGYYKLGFHLDAEVFGLDRARLVAAVRAEGVALDEGFRALHVGRSAERYRAAGPLDEATRTHHRTVILHHPVLLGGEEEIEQVARALEKVHAHAGRLTAS